MGELIIRDGAWRHMRSDKPILVGGFRGHDASHADADLGHTNTVRGSLILSDDGVFSSPSDLWVANGPSRGFIEMSGGDFSVANVAHTAVVRIGSREGNVLIPGIGTLNLSGGTMTVDRLVATGRVDSAIHSIVNFMGGALTGREILVDNDAVFEVGDGTRAAALTLLTGTAPHRFADGLTVMNQGSLGGTATLDTPWVTVASGGRLRPGLPGAAGTLSVDGDVTLTAGSILEIGLAGPLNHGVLTVDGAVVLGGGLDVALLDGYQPDGGSRFTIATATGGVTGKFDSVPDGFVVTVEGNDVVLGPPRGTLMMLR